MKRLLIALSLISSPSYAAQDDKFVRDELSSIQAQLDLIEKKPQIEKWCGMHLKTLGYGDAVLDVDYEAGIWYSFKAETNFVGCRIYIEDLLAQKDDSFLFVDFDVLRKYKPKSKIKPKKKQTDCK